MVDKRVRNQPNSLGKLVPLGILTKKPPLQTLPKVVKWMVVHRSKINMTKYKIKNFRSTKSEVMQGLIKNWIESRNHISIINMNTWKDKDMTYSTIIYIENEYSL